MRGLLEKWFGLFREARFDQTLGFTGLAIQCTRLISVVNVRAIHGHSKGSLDELAPERDHETDE